MDKNKLKSVAYAHGETLKDLADAIGMSRSAFSLKLNERTDSGFTQPEIKQIKDHYNLSAEDVDLIFFADLVTKNDTFGCSE
jgi:transcriptional regulator with XRE-family HTH domain